MNKDTITKGAIALVVLSGIMIVTNPSKDGYVDYAAPKLVPEIQSAICKGPQLPQGLNIAGTSAGDICKNAISIGLGLNQNTLKQFIDTTTTRQNLILFSIYTTEVPGATFKTLGVFGNYITFAK